MDGHINGLQVHAAAREQTLHEDAERLHALAQRLGTSTPGLRSRVGVALIGLGQALVRLDGASEARPHLVRPS
jgi:hypothetical protein